jgi:hypothetical protein
MSKVIALMPLGFDGAAVVARAAPIRMEIGSAAAAAVKLRILRRLIESTLVSKRLPFIFLYS